MLGLMSLFRDYRIWCFMKAFIAYLTIQANYFFLISLMQQGQYLQSQRQELVR